MSTKIYYGFRSPEHAMNASVTWLRRAIWRNVVALVGPQITTYDDAGRIAKEYAEAGFHVWHDPHERIALYSLFGLPRFCHLPKLPYFLREYSYWNNTDEPEGMTRRRWTERGRTWNRVALDGERWEERMTNIVLSGDCFGQHALALECISKYRDEWLGKRTLLSEQPLPTRIG